MSRIKHERSIIIHLYYIHTFNVETEKIIFQNVRISEVCDQNGDGVSKNYKSSHIFSMRLKRVLVKYEKYGALSIHVGIYTFL